ncbi:MAG: sensor histidine kinase, partial [Nitrospinaceae bacterium]
YQHLQQVREEERTRMSREFHDHLGQMLTTLKLELSLLDRKLAKEGSGCRNHTGWLLDLVEGTLPAVKQLVMDLRPPVLDDLGLKEAIEWLCRDFEKRTGTVCSLNLDGGVEALDQDLNTALFRIFQETLTNVARHAEATHVEVLFEEREGQLVLEVNDNGKGIEPWKVSDLKSLGLLGMKERVLPWGGVVDVRGSAEKGTTVTIKIQMEKQ